ncbi:tRNA 2-selenouridine(34) synthase MnmH [Dendrosporobacter sp. 1207_IL3150]|uniref:tRNA 2-selenouridine(34) synthase MnmH n=1 Tax=Dendrosporobacter sp. 1207_IL3150 TaxID=3084054 RepID=UPI002FD9D041
MHKTVDFESSKTFDNPIYIDVRSPSEYLKGHIPNSVNIPIFSDEERALVGTIYKNIGSEEAKDKGLEIVSTKLPDIIRQIQSHYKMGKRLIIYCWRGGMRSKSIVSILAIMGIKSYQLIGGYKEYRNYVLKQLASFKIKPEIYVLCGSTGVGKTNILNLLKKINEPIIDIEQLANHRGSIFGQIGLGQPASAQSFDSLLLNELEQLNNSHYIILESESKRVGNVYIPDILYNAMKSAKRILIYADLEIRAERLINEYFHLNMQNTQSIADCINSLSKRLGVKKTKQLLNYLESGNIRQCALTLINEYYDPLYGYEKQNDDEFDLVVCSNNLNEAANKIINYLRKTGR